MVRFKNILAVSFILLAVYSSTCNASVNTLDLVDSYDDGSDTVCIYSDGHRTETFVKEGAGSCPSKKTFHD